MTDTAKYIYRFSEGNAQMRNLLGGKGANLSEMVSLGLPIPQGFVITTDVSLIYYDLGKRMPDGLWEDIMDNIRFLEADVNRKLGDVNNPLLLSVRSGARISMPGMMDTILNLGINDQVVEGLARQMNDRRPAFDAYRRFIQIFADVAMGVPGHVFEDILEEHKQRAGVTLDHELQVEQLLPLIDEFKSAVVQHTGRKIPLRPLRAATPGRSRRFRKLEQPPRLRIPQLSRHPPRLRHRRQHHDYGLRQHRPR